MYVSFQALIDQQQQGDAGASSSSRSAISLVAKLLFAVMLCTALLLFEKFSIQWIAAKFHERSYAGTSPLLPYIYASAPVAPRR